MALICTLKKVVNCMFLSLKKTHTCTHMHIHVKWTSCNFRGGTHLQVPCEHPPEPSPGMMQERGPASERGDLHLPTDRGPSGGHRLLGLAGQPSGGPRELTFQGIPDLGVQARIGEGYSGKLHGRPLWKGPFGAPRKGGWGTSQETPTLRGDPGEAKWGAMCGAGSFSWILIH